MHIGSSLVSYSTRRPKTIALGMCVITFVIAVLAVLPTLWPQQFAALNPLRVDTDPENMLPEDEAVRVFHDLTKSEMGLRDMVVLGVVNETDPNGVFNPTSLARIYDLAEFAKGLRWPDAADPEKQVGVVEVDLLAPSTVDNIEQGEGGAIRFEWLMQSPPATTEEAIAIRDKAMRIPFLKDTLVSGDGKAVCLYLPITSKDLSYEIYAKLREKIAGFEGDEEYFITGLPVAEDVFGVEMFKQMAISAPVAMAIIFMLMLFFFRKFVLIVSPMIVAVVSVICTMGLLVIVGKTVHIMSSMIPIFIMPIAVLDAIHILSEFFDRYAETRDRKRTIEQVMATLFMPMLYTSLTTAAGFASLALTPIPPVQVFGLFVAFGVMVAWLFTVTFIPAYVMFIPERWFENFGHRPSEASSEHPSLLARALARLGPFTRRRASRILIGTVILSLVAAAGINRIKINDNPTKWFAPSHPIRVADKKLNAHFGGTYVAYLAFQAPKSDESSDQYVAGFLSRFNEREKKLASPDETVPKVFAAVRKMVDELRASALPPDAFQEKLSDLVDGAADEADFDEDDAWNEASLFISTEQQRGEVFKQPRMLEYMAGLQEHLLTTGVVGKSNSLADIVKTVHRELLSGEDADFRIPASAAGVAECLIQFQNSHRPGDLWHFVTTDYRKSVLWIQLKSGDNRDMSRVVRAVEKYVGDNPPPLPTDIHWFGLTYINVIWQEKMVSGMLQAFAGSFLVVLLMMILLFRSGLWGLLCMVPLTVTIGLIYGAIGIMGKDYDMPVAVLSSLSLGLSVDYAIHFLSRARSLHAAHGSWDDTVGPLFDEPARAIARNVIVVGVGFLPLVMATLVPYQTVGIFIAAILLAAGVATLLILPALITVLEKWLFPATHGKVITCVCGTCLLTVATLVALVALTVNQFVDVAWPTLTWISVGVVVVLAILCQFLSRREKCRILESSEEKG